MGFYKYTDDEKDRNKVLKMNQDMIFRSEEVISDALNKVNNPISSSEELLKSLGYELPKTFVSNELSMEDFSKNVSVVPDYDSLVQKANIKIPHDVELEDLLSAKEFKDAYARLDSINKEFSQKTSIVNKTDITFLAIATALQTAKSLLFGYVAGKFDYGNSFDPENRLDHNDKSINDAHKKANEEFIEKHGREKKGFWMQILYQPPAFDITRGSGNIGKEMHGRYHRLYSLGHDPILGWLFGTANILTDTITFENFKTNRVTRKPVMKITRTNVSLPQLFSESVDMVKADYLNLPAAIFAEAQHLKSDRFTKLGLPVPILETINETFASELYKKNYDSLCFSRDLKIIGVSAAISILIDMIIVLVHGLFNKESSDKKLYEVRTRKILLISNSIASTSNVIKTVITRNPKNLDIGGLLLTLSHLFCDVKFIANIKQEFIQSELGKDFNVELKKLGIT